MEIQKALDQISEIHGHLAKADVYRGYKAVPVAASGVVAFAAAAVQTYFVTDTPESFVLYWVIVAAVAAVIAGGGIVYSYVLQESRAARRHTRVVVGQLLPPMAAGVVVTAVVMARASDAAGLLPGLWAAFFSLGIFASRPYLPRNIGWVALYYLMAAAVLLAMSVDQAGLSPWGMGLTFGIGQVLAGLVLYWDLERNSGR